MAKTTLKTGDVERLNFEQAVQKLREIVEKVEAGQVGLEESIRQYELGCKLIRHCREILNRAEQRIETLSRNLDGTLDVEPASTDLQSEPPAEQ
jgi:exodeoxyribonuclease VII small subunit